MADGPLGYSFAPTFENAEMGRQGGSPAEFPQGSIKVLNFQVPRIAGAPGPNAISPLVGDRSAGSGGFGGAVLQSVLHTVLGPDAAAAFSSASPGASIGGASARDPGAALLEEWLRRERELNGRGGGGGGDPERSDYNEPAGGPSSYPSPSAPAPSYPTPGGGPDFGGSAEPPPLHSPGPPTVTPGGDAGDPGSPPSSSADPVPDDGSTGPSFDSSPAPSWRDDKYDSGWGQDYQAL